MKDRNMAMNLMKNRMRFSIILVTILVAIMESPAQNVPVWTTLPNAPVVARHNDAYFVNPDTGWIVNGDGQIYRTNNGGAAWQLQFVSGTAHFRSVGFLNELEGWAGNVGVGEFGATDPNVFYRTRNGGQSWQAFSQFHGPAPAGVCGMHVVNDSTICAVGRVRGPSFFVRTTDGGARWTSKDMREYAAGLIDVYFIHPDTGFAVGLTNVVHDFSSGVVLFTSDGGNTWERRFVTARMGEWCWKISFPSRKTAYVSLQRNSLSPIYFLKTADGGNTWQEKLFSTSYYFVQGIGFISESRGWAGGNSSFPTYETRDGGETWRSAGFGTRVNRFRFLNDSLGYAVGQRVYKYAKAGAVSVQDRADESAWQYALSQNYPNPFNPSTTIRFQLSERMFVSLRIYDVNGRQVKEVMQRVCEAGENVVTWKGTDDHGKPARSGTYVYKLEAGELLEVRKMVLVR